MIVRTILAIGSALVILSAIPAASSSGQDRAAVEKRRNGGYLGIFIRERQPGQIEIERVHPGGGADKAGLKAGDIIESVDGRRLQNGDQFIRRMWSSRPFALGVRRGDDRVTIRTSTAQLDAWPKVGDAAPRFTLKRRDNDESVALDDLLGTTKPVVLVFGSFT